MIQITSTDPRLLPFYRTGEFGRQWALGNRPFDDNGRIVWLKQATTPAVHRPASYPLANVATDKPGDIIRFPDGSLGRCRDAGVYVAYKPGDDDDWDAAPAATPAATQARPTATLAERVPTRNELLQKLRGDYFERHDGELYCAPLKHYISESEPGLLIGYATIWNAPTGPRSDGRPVILRRGCLPSEPFDCDALACHDSRAVIASKEDRSLALVEDSIGLAVFARVRSGNHLGAMTIEAVRAADVPGMSLYLEPLEERTSIIDGKPYRDVSKLAALKEVSFSEAPSNLFTTAGVVGYAGKPGAWRLRGIFNDRFVTSND